MRSFLTVRRVVAKHLSFTACGGVMKRGLAIACLTIALTGGDASAASHPPTVDPHPDVPQNPTWVRGTLTGILLLFAFAIPVGIILRANMPDPPPAESHDE